MKWSFQIPKIVFVYGLLVGIISCNDEIQDYQFHETDMIQLSSGVVVKHTYFQLAYSEPNEQAEWVFFKLTQDLVNGSQERTEDFKEDPLVTWKIRSK